MLNLKRLLIYTIILQLSLGSLAFLPLNTAEATTGVPTIINYQGRLKDSSGNLLGGSSGTTYYFKFSIYDDATYGSGSKLWPTSSPSSTSATVTDGIFSVNIGDTDNGYPDALDFNFFDNQDVYLQVEISDDNSTFEALTTRKRITAAPYAINSKTLGGVTASTTATASQIPIVNASSNLILPGDLSIAGRNITINSGMSGETTAWATTTELLDGRFRVRGGAIVNGYIYAISGLPSSGWTPTTTVTYSKIKSDGTLGSWQESPNALPVGSQQVPIASYKGYIYVVSGTNDAIYYAKVNSDGSTKSWQTASNNLPAKRQHATVFINNGYMYVVGGTDSSWDFTDTVYISKLNADGSPGSWSTSVNSLPSATSCSGAVLNSYLYCFAYNDTSVYYTKVSNDGSIDSWSTAANGLPDGNPYQNVFSANGYLYVAGGVSSSGEVYYSKPGSDGAPAAWLTSGNSMLTGVGWGWAASANGYLYVIGGSTTGADRLTTVQYTSTARTKIGGTLDLLGLQTVDLGQGQGGGGAIYAGELFSNNTLEVLGQTTLWNGLGVNGAVSIHAPTGTTPSPLLYVQGKVRVDDGLYNIGIDTLDSETFDDLTTGTENIAIGHDSFVYATEASYSVAIGRYAMGYVITGDYNTAIGNEAMTYNETGDYNTALGHEALSYTTAGDYNTAIGSGALANIGGTNNNTGIGAYTGYSSESGAANTTLLGYQAGYNTASSSIFIGYQAGYNENTANRLYISNSSTTSPLIYGEFDNQKIGINTSVPSSTLHVVGKLQVARTSDSANIRSSGIIFPGDNVLQSNSANEIEDKTGIIIPMYIYPTDIYNNTDYNTVIDLKKQYHDVPLYVILNPSSGPGVSVDANYAVALERLRGAGAKVIGYVSTAYTSNTLASVKSDIDDWLTLYPDVDGIFLDEMTNTSSTTYIDYYVDLTKYSHQQGLYPVIGNPGANTTEGYFSSLTADTIIINEVGTYPTEATLKGDYAGGHADYKYTKRGGIVYGQSFNTASSTLMKKYLGMMYITDDTLANPYDALPTELETLFKFLETDGSRHFGDLHIDGNLGVGTLVPSSTLHVVGTLQTTATSTFGGSIVIGGDTITDFAGTGLLATGGNLTVSGLTTTEFATTSVSQWANDAGYTTGTSLLIDGSNWMTGNIESTGAVTLKSRRNLLTASSISDDLDDNSQDTGLWETVGTSAVLAASETSDVFRISYIEDDFSSSPKFYGYKTKYALQGNFDIQLTVPAFNRTVSATSGDKLALSFIAVPTDEPESNVSASVDSAVYIEDNTDLAGFMLSLRSGADSTGYLNSYAREAGSNLFDDTSTYTYAAGDVYRLVRSGSTITLYQDSGSGWVSTGTGTWNTQNVNIYIIGSLEQSTNRIYAGSGFDLTTYTAAVASPLKTSEDGPYVISSGYGDNGLGSGESIHEFYRGVETTSTNLVAKVTAEGFTVGSSTASQIVLSLTGDSYVDSGNNFAVGTSTAASLFSVATSTAILNVYETGGVVLGNASGTDKGYGTLNAVGVYDDETLLTDYVFDYYFDGEVGEGDIGLHGEYKMPTLSEMKSYVEENRHLPGIPGREEWKENGSFSLGRLLTGVWRSTEEQALYLYEVDSRLGEIERQLGIEDLQGELIGEGQVDSDVPITPKSLVIGKDLVIKGTVSFNKDTVGRAKILPGDMTVRVEFEKEYEDKPVVVLTPELVGDFHYAAVNVSTQGFNIDIDRNQNQAVVFSWLAFAPGDDPVIHVSTGSFGEVSIEVVEPEVVEPEVVLEEEVIPEEEVPEEEVVEEEPEVVPEEEVVEEEPEVVPEEEVIPEEEVPEEEVIEEEPGQVVEEEIIEFEEVIEEEEVIPEEEIIEPEEGVVEEEIAEPKPEEVIEEEVVEPEPEEEVNGGSE